MRGKAVVVRPVSARVRQLSNTLPWGWTHVTGGRGLIKHPPGSNARTGPPRASEGRPGFKGAGPGPYGADATQLGTTSCGGVSLPFTPALPISHKTEVFASLVGQVDKATQRGRRYGETGKTRCGMPRDDRVFSVLVACPSDVQEEAGACPEGRGGSKPWHGSAASSTAGGCRLANSC